MRKLRQDIFYFIVIIPILLNTCTENSNSKKVGMENNETRPIQFGKTKKELVFTFNKVDDDDSQRKISEINLNSKLEIGGIDTNLFLYPSNVRIDEKKNIYIVDNLDCSVSKFDKSGNFITKYGRKGKGPGEFDNAFYFDVTQDGKVAIVSPNDFKFTVFDNDKMFEVKDKNSPNRLCFFSSEEIIIFQLFDPITTSPIVKVNFKNRELFEYQNILSKKTFGGENFGMLPLLLGDIHNYNKNQIVYIARVLGYIIIYNETGKISKVFKQLNKSKTPGYERIESKNKDMDSPIIRFPRREELLFRCTNVYKDNLYILLEMEDENSEEFIVDIYSLQECKYKNSIILKGFGDIIGTYFTDKELYVIKGNTELEVLEYIIIDE
ncbi:MAG: 6-bladed beta-propeller [Ignavibacteriae bacterium]|nr:6-bladed beta-propeller [Ignavibacteriota bacterium]